MENLTYVSRQIESLILKTHKTFKVLYLGGPRQVGKTTVLRHIARHFALDYVTLDNLEARQLARTDPKLFLDQYRTPLLIDEVQYAPELFSAIKMKVDQSNHNGQYWLTGSQQFSMIKNLQESLAGRVGILTLLGFSFRELYPQWQLPQPFSWAIPLTTLPDIVPPPSVHELFNFIVRGCFPILWHPTTAPERDQFLQTYIQTYVDRDLSSLFHVSKLFEFHKFLRLCAERTGQILNLSELARDASVSVHAAKEWLSILEQTHLVYLLRPYRTNHSARLIKSPKLYFLDTGLACYLTGWPNVDTVLKNGNWAGTLFETFVVNELLKSFFYRGNNYPPLFYYRDQQGHEVDVIIEQDRALYPIEIKLSKTIRRDDISSISYIQKQFKNIKLSYIISLVDRWQYIGDKDTIAVPFTII